MALLPDFTVLGSKNSDNSKTKLYYVSLDDKGYLSNAYSPLQNLTAGDTGVLGDFTTKKLAFDLNHPVDILVLDHVDGAVNLILNDGINKARLINTRMSVKDGYFSIPDHAGYKDTNVYSEKYFDFDTSLKLTPIKIPKIEFVGLHDKSGSIPCGSYNFYFKFSDADGNETEVVAESGLVLVHIGEVNNPTTMRMGLGNENSEKSLSFKITNIDPAFDFIHVLCARHTSEQTGVRTAPEYIKIRYDYPIYNSECTINITWNELKSSIDPTDLNINYADINSCKTHAIYKKALLQANTDIPERHWDELKKISWKIIPRPVQLKSNEIGHLDADYKDSSISKTPGCYYNMKNVYDHVGYWPDEIYRFGIVYIYDDNNISPVFNIQGIDLGKVLKSASDDYKEGDNILYGFKYTNGSYYYRLFFDTEGRLWENDPDDMMFHSTYDFGLNSKGVIRMPKVDTLAFTGSGKMVPRPLGIEFDMRYIDREYISLKEGDNTESEDTGLDNEGWKQCLRNLGIKGYFFVRLKRIPTIFGQGIAIGVTDREHGAIPVIKKNNGYYSLSFLNSNRLISQEGVDIPVKDSNVTVQGLLFPDADTDEDTFNSYFCGNEYALIETALYGFRWDNNDKTSKLRNITPVNNPRSYIALLTRIPELQELRTDGTSYFSTQAGDPIIPYKTKDVENIWNKTVPLKLTKSTSLVRGLFSPYVGVTVKNVPELNVLRYGRVYTVKSKLYAEDEDTAVKLDFQKRAVSDKDYRAISDRIGFEDLNSSKSTCFRGDCFLSLYTHRVIRNFIDKDTPTNHVIVNPNCWNENYAVRCTTQIMEKVKRACLKEDAGWFIQETSSSNLSIAKYKLLYINWLNGLTWEKDAEEKLYLDGIEKVYKLDLIDSCAQVLSGSNEIDGVPYKNGLYFDGKNSVKFVIILKRNDDQTYYKVKTVYFDKEETEVTPENGVVYNFAEYLQTTLTPPGIQSSYANQVEPAFEIDILSRKSGRKRKVEPKELESNSGLAGTLKKLFKPSINWELRGTNNINRSDLNAVGLGLWITFPILTSKNLALRDVDYSNSQEEATFSRKRGFYPLYPKDINNPMPDSHICNKSTGVSVPDRVFIGLPHSSFFRQEYLTRIYNSLPLQNNSHTNNFRHTNDGAYKDYPKLYGSITKLEVIGEYIFVIFKHGIGILTLNTEAKSANDLLLPSLQMVSTDVGSIWKDSICNTGLYIYGIDSVAKKIWRVSTKGFEEISSKKILRFLNENLNMSEFTTSPTTGHINIKTHYNSFKNDVIFTYYNDTLGQVKTSIDGDWKDSKQLIYGAIEGVTKTIDTIKAVDNNSVKEGLKWSLCFNEQTGKFSTFYDWYPLESANIDNIWFSFDMDHANKLHNNSSVKELMHITSINGNGSFILDKADPNYSLSFKERKYTIDNTFRNICNVYYFSKKEIIAKLIKSILLNIVNLDNDSKKGYVFSFYCKAWTSSLLSIQIDANTYTIDVDNNWHFYQFYINKLNNISPIIKLPEETILFTEFKVEQLSDTFRYSSCISEDDYIKVAVPLSTISNRNKVELQNVYDIRNTENFLPLWKHGQAGVYDNLEIIKPSHWYGKLHDWYFEFIAKDLSSVLNIFNNLKIVSNKTAPYKFEYEVVGEGYSWYQYKPLIAWINTKVDDGTYLSLNDGYQDVLSRTYLDLHSSYFDFPTLFSEKIPKKLPFLRVVSKELLIKKSADLLRLKDWHGGANEAPKIGTLDYEYEDNTSATVLIVDSLLNENLIHTQLLGNDIRKYGRVRGNMQYLEDLWLVEIRPIAYREAYLNNGELKISKKLSETRFRDKYLKVKVRYTGLDLALINGIVTVSQISYA